MGMTDKQFSGFLRFVVDALEEIKAETDEKKKNEKLQKVIEHMRDTMED